MGQICKNCFSKLTETDSVCSVCKIDHNKGKQNLTKEERKISYWCRSLHVIGFLSIIGGFLGIAIGLFTLFAEKTNILIIIPIIFSGIFLYFGLSLRRFDKWCYAGGIALYSIALVFALLDKNIIRGLIAALFLYYLVSPTSKKILYREL